MDSTEIFAMALNLESPWFIKDIKLEKPGRLKRGQLDIYIDFKPGAKFKDEHGVLCGGYDTEERTW